MFRRHRTHKDLILEDYDYLQRGQSGPAICLTILKLLTLVIFGLLMFVVTQVAMAEPVATAARSSLAQFEAMPLVFGFCYFLMIGIIWYSIKTEDEHMFDSEHIQENNTLRKEK